MKTLSEVETRWAGEHAESEISDNTFRDTRAAVQHLHLVLSSFVDGAQRCIPKWYNSWVTWTLAVILNPRPSSQLLDYKSVLSRVHPARATKGLLSTSPNPSGAQHRTGQARLVVSLSPMVHVHMSHRCSSLINSLNFHIYPMPSIEILPTELLQQLIALPVQTDLAQCIRVSREWSNLFTPLLCRLYLNSHSILLFSLSRNKTRSG